jgi:hypothetical protein
VENEDEQRDTVLLDLESRREWRMKMNRERNGYSVLFECDRESVE